MFRVDVSEDMNNVKVAKQKDVVSLLTAMGEDSNREVMDFYRPICANAEIGMDTEDSGDGDEALVEEKP